MKLILDLDGVLVDFVGGACKALGIDDPYRMKESLGEWDITKLINMPKAKFWAALNNMSFWSNLEWTKDAQDILSLVENRFKKIIICTSPTVSPSCSAGKHFWIHKNLSRYKDKFMIGAPKEYFANFDTVLVDDKDDNVNKFIEAGGNAVLVPRLWNKNHNKPTLEYLKKELYKLN